MKKIMMADVIKAVVDERDLAIKEIADIWDITIDEATYLYDNYPNETDQRQVLETAEALDIPITDVEDDDVENLQELWDLAGSQGNQPYSTIESSIGKVHPWYDHVLKSLMILIIFSDGHPANYPISREDLAQLTQASSFGKAFNEKFRNNPQYSDQPGAWGCIGPNPDSPKRLMTAEDKATLPKNLQELV
jgi:hypothetical protein